MVARASRELAVAERPQFAAQRRLAQRYPELIPEPLHQILQPPAHHPMDSRDRAALHQSQQGLAVAGAQLADIPRRLAVNQAFGPMGVEPHHPVPHRLQADPADPRRPGPRAAIVDLGQRQQPSALPSIAGRFG
jgi:hypothetical protein